MAKTKKAAAPATKGVPVPGDPDLAKAHATYQVRIDECERTLRTGKTGDPARPFFYAFALEAIIACHRRLQRGLTDPLMA